MSRRDNAQNRCPKCAMHFPLCICEEMPCLNIKNRLCLILHRDEVRKPTNTGMLAARCLPHSEILVHGIQGKNVAAPWQDENVVGPKGGLVLYPDDGAEVLSQQHLVNGPVRLVIPDGTWRQAAKMTRRIPWVADLPRVRLPPGEETLYRLRSEPKDGGLATMEAIARAFGILEGPKVQKALEDIFHKMVDRTLYARGMLARDQVFGGVPQGAMRHDPRKK